VQSVRHSGGTGLYTRHGDTRNRGRRAHATHVSLSCLCRCCCCVQAAGVRVADDLTSEVGWLSSVGFSAHTPSAPSSLPFLPNISTAARWMWSTDPTRGQAIPTGTTEQRVVCKVNVFFRQAEPVPAPATDTQSQPASQSSALVSPPALLASEAQSPAAAASSAWSQPDSGTEGVSSNHTSSSRRLMQALPPDQGDGTGQHARQARLSSPNPLRVTLLTLFCLMLCSLLCVVCPSVQLPFLCRCFVAARLSITTVFLACAQQNGICTSSRATP
jgi:hypothetical protein